MASNTIAKTSLELTANAGGLNAGLDQAAKRLADWQKSVEAKLKGLQRQQAIGNNLASVSALSGAYTAVSAFVGRVTAAFTELGERIRKVVNDAQALGTGVQGLQRIGYAAKAVGVDAGSLQAALGNMFSVLRSAQRPQALQQLGLDLDALGRADAQDALVSVVAALEGISDPMARAQAATALFGDSTQAVLPLLNKGADGIRQFVNEAKGFGIGEIDTGQLRQTSEAVNRMDAAWQSLKDTVMAGVAPALEGVFSWLADAVGNADQHFASLGLGVQNAFDNVIWGLQSAFTQVVGRLGKAWDWLMEKVGRPPKSGESWDDWMVRNQKAVTDAANGRQALYKQDYDREAKARATAKKADTTLDRKDEDPATKVRDQITAQKLALAKALNDAETDLQGKVRTIGLTAGEAKVFELRLKGVAEKDLSLVKQLAEQAKNVEIAFGNVKMPNLETFEQSIKGLNEMRKVGRLNEQQGRLGALEAARNLMSQTLTQPQAVGAAVKDSSEAATAVINARMQEQRQDPQAELRRAMMEAKEIQKQQLETAQKMLDVLKDNKDFDIEAL